MPKGGQIFGGGGIERERIKSCTAPDDPNYLSPTPTIPQNTTNYTGRAFCDDFALDIPWRKGFKLAGTTPVRVGHRLQRRAPEQREPDQHPHDERHEGNHALPGGLSVAVSGGPDHHADRLSSASPR